MTGVLTRGKTFGDTQGAHPEKTEAETGVVSLGV